MKRLISPIALALLVCFSLLSSNASLVKAFDYTYTITIYSGNQGDFVNASAVQVPSGASVDTVSAEKIVVSGLKYGDVVSCNGQEAVKLNEDSKYYVKGIRLSGRDNNTVAYSSFTVFEDQDYVVAYGIKGELTEYTVNYFDEDGNSLAESRTYYGNVGDSPVIAYLYIEGYAPSDFNISRELVSDSTQNVFTFTYIENSTSPNNSDDNNNDNDDDNNNDDGDDNGGGNNDNGGNDNNGGDNNGGNGNAQANEPGGNGNADDINAPVETDEGNDITEGNEQPPKNIPEEEKPAASGNNGKHEPIKDKISWFDLIFKDGLILPILLVLTTVLIFTVSLVLIVRNRKNIKVQNVDKDDKN